MFTRSISIGLVAVVLLPHTLHARDPNENYSVTTEIIGSTYQELHNECRRQLNLGEGAIAVGTPTFQFRRCVNRLRREQQVPVATRRERLESRERRRHTRLDTRAKNFAKQDAMQRSTSIHRRQRVIRSSIRSVRSIAEDHRAFHRAKAAERKDIQALEHARKREKRTRSLAGTKARRECRGTRGEDRAMCMEKVLKELRSE